jgi:hypothetical protein
MVLVLGLLLLMAINTGSETLSKRSALERETHFTPVVMSVLASPHPTSGSDGLIHLVYEVRLTNATSFTVKVESIEVLDATHPERVLAAFSGNVIPKQMQGLITKSPTDALESGQTVIFFIHFTMEKAEDQLTALAHRLTISGEFPPGFTHFMGLPASENRIVELGGLTDIHSVRPIVIGPPIEGRGWIAADGCCTAKRHIRAIMPINGQLRVAQRFAIDWELMNDEHRLYVGDPSDVKSYFAYGKKVLAVADSTVVRVVDEYKDQVPGKLPSGMTLAEADGNHIVLDLGNEQFAFYAHLKPGSIQAHGVKVGEGVWRGQVLGLVGNTGNTTAPHLHFHLMSSPSTLGSNGLPYLIEEFELLGRALSTAAFDKAEQEGTPLAIQEVDNPGRHSDELPLDLSVAGFPTKQKNCVGSGGEAK